MHDLTLVGVHDDGEHVVLAAADGHRYKLLVDEQLRAAVRRDRPRLGQLQIQTDGRLRPRDIQARIRAGQSADEVAEASGLPIEQVRRFEGPVLAEREHMAREARRVPLRRGPAAPAAPAAPALRLGALVVERLACREVDAAHAAWDSWRAEDGSWTVQVSFTAGNRDRRACWSFDPHLRHVSALDDEARWLSEPEHDDVGPLPQRRLAPVPEVIVDVTGRQPQVTLDADPEPDVTEPDVIRLDVSEPALIESVGAGVQDGAEAPQVVAADPTVDLLDSLSARRGRRSRPVPPEDDEAAGGDSLEDLLGTLMTRDEVLTGTPPVGAGSDQARDPVRDPMRDPGPNHPARRAMGRQSRRRDAARTKPAAPPAPDIVHLPDEPKLPVGSRVAPPSTLSLSGGDGTSGVSAPPPLVPTSTPIPSATAPTTAAGGAPGAVSRPSSSARKSRRTSVPSWDDIVFGSRRE